MFQKATQNLSDVLLESVEASIDENPFGFSEEKIINTLADKIESSRKYKIKDFETLIQHYTTEGLTMQVQLYKSQKTNEDLSYGSSDKSEEEYLKKKMLAMEVAKKVLEKSRNLRRERNRKTSRIDTNLLTHPPFFVGGSNAIKNKAKKDTYIKLDKKGFRKMTYENKQGVLLTSNDARTLLALFAIKEEQDQQKILTFTEYQIIEKLNMGLGGKQYEIVRESIEKLRNTNIVLQDAYVLSEGRRTVTESFPLIISNKYTVDQDDKGRLRSKRYEVEFSPYISKSFNDGYCTLISLAVFDELETNVGQAIYLLISGIKDMDDNEDYLLEDGSFYIPLDKMYDSLFLQDVNRKNKATIEKGCEELKNIDIITEYRFVKQGRKFSHIVITPSEWLNDILTKKKHFLSLESEQLSFNNIEEYEAAEPRKA